MTTTSKRTKWLLSIVASCLVISFVGGLTGCASLTLRPVQRDHAIRHAEVTNTLGVEAPVLDSLLKAEQAECDALDTSVTRWTAATMVVGVLSGGSGVTALFTESTPRYVVGGVAIALAATSALTSFMSTANAQRYSRRCAVNLGGR